MSASNPSPKEIPAGIKDFGQLTEDFPGVGRVEWTDAMIVFSPAMAFLLLGNYVVPASISFLVLPFAILLAFMGAIVLILKPDYISLTQWIRNYRHYKRTPNPITKTLNKNEDTGEETIEINGIETATDDTRDWIRIKKIYPGQGAVERVDGTLIGIARIHGLNLDKASASRIDDSVRTFSDYLNNQLKNEIQIYLPMRSFDPAEQVKGFKERRKDPDIQRKSLMKSYMQDRINWYRKVIGENYIRECYVVVKVDESEVRNQSLTQTQTRSNIENIPVFGPIIKLIVDEAFGSSDQLFTEEDIIAEQIDILNKRVSEVSRGFVQGINQSSERLSSAEIAGLLREFWQGKEVRDDETENLVRESQFVAGETDLENQGDNK